MSECYGKIFIKNGKVFSRHLFSDEEIKVGKSIYEVLRVIEGVPLFLEKHMSRFSNSAGIIGRSMLLSNEELIENIKKLIKEENVVNGNIKLIFNYGENSNSYYLYFLKHSYPTDDMYLDGVSTMFYHRERENPNAKVINLGFREAVERSIREKSVYEAILVDNNGYITEGSKSNIFMVYDNKVITSPVEAVLPGVTRDIIIFLIKNAKIPFYEEKYSFENIGKLDGLFISGTSPKVLPIKTVDNFKFESSQNEVILKIKDLFDKYTQNYVNERKL